MNETLKTSLAHWPELSQSVFVPHTEIEYRRLVALLDQLVDEVGNDQGHPLASPWKSSACSSRSTRTSKCRSWKSRAQCGKSRRQPKRDNTVPTPGILPDNKQPVTDNQSRRVFFFLL